MVTETKKAAIKIILMLLAFVVVAGYLARVYVDAKSPSSVRVTVYKVEFMTDKKDAQPLVVFSSAAGKEIDLVSEPGDFIAPGGASAGVYNRIRLTVKNGITMSVANAENNPCGGAPFTDQVSLLVEGADPNSQAPIYFASAEDGGGTWQGSQIVNLLVKPLTINRDRTTEVKLRFIADETLFCLSGEVARRAPWSVWPEMKL